MYINHFPFAASPNLYQRAYPYCFSPPLGQAAPCCSRVSGDRSTLSAQARLLRALEALSLLSSDTFETPAQVEFGRRGPMECSLGMGPFLSPRPEPGPSARPISSASQPPSKPASTTGAKVEPLRQSNSVSCGQTSVAMAVNSLTGKSLTDSDIARKHGFSLLSALNSESRAAGFRWRDGGDFRAEDWATLEKKLNKEKTPVIMGLNGPTFSPSGRGHIITLISIDGNRVSYADPADGKIKTTTKQVIEQSPGHPQGKFFFYAARG